jgi:hypothetical protein
MKHFITAVSQQIKNQLQNFFNLIKSNWKIILFKHISQALLSTSLEYLISLIF